ncbi:MAG: adenosine kinase [Granulosicoccaceae bacterium]
MTDYHVYGAGNALVDMEFEISDEILAELGVDKGLMTLIDEDRHHELLDKLGGLEAKQGSGGSAANTIIASAQLGANTFYSCKVASDPTGDFYMKDLDACKVASNLTASNRDAGTTGKCIVLITPDAERSMNSHLGITQQYSKAELDLDAIKQSDYVYIEGYLVPEENARAAAICVREVAEASGVKTSITLSDGNMVTYFKAGLLEMIGGGVDMLFCNEDEACGMLDASSIEDCVAGLKKFAKQFAITRGSEGATLWDGEKAINISAQQVTPLDSNGAGDIYAGAFMYGLTHGMQFEKCGELANACAAELITHFGARLPDSAMKSIGTRFA